MCVDTVTSSGRVESFETRNMSSRAWEWSGVEACRVSMHIHRYIDCTEPDGFDAH